MSTYIIIGNGVAGTTAAENIRKNDGNSEVIIITDENLPFYYRTRLNEFISGEVSIRGEFIRLVNLYGNISQFSPGINRSDPSFAPGDDILGKPRSEAADIGAFEYSSLSLNRMRETQQK